MQLSFITRAGLSIGIIGGQIYNIFSNDASAIKKYEDEKIKAKEQTKGIDTEEFLLRKQAKTIIKQAYKAVDFSGTVKVNIIKDPRWLKEPYKTLLKQKLTPEELATINNRIALTKPLHASNRGLLFDNSCAIATFTYSHKDQLKNHRELFAIAAHEGVHAKHQHTRIDQTISRLLTVLPFIVCKTVTPLILSSTLMAALRFTIRRLEEIDADITSAKKSGSAADHIESLENFERSESILRQLDNEVLELTKDCQLPEPSAEQNKDEFHLRIEFTLPAMPDEHPATKTRVKYLRPYITGESPAFFKSEAYHELLQQKLPDIKKIDQPPVKR